MKTHKTQIPKILEKQSSCLHNDNKYIYYPIRDCLATTLVYVKLKINYERFWKLLALTGLKKDDLRKMAESSTVTMAKLGKKQDVNTSTLLKICEDLKCTFDDVISTELETENIRTATEMSVISTANSKESIILGNVHSFHLATVFSGIGAVEHALERIAFFSTS